MKNLRKIGTAILILGFLGMVLHTTPAWTADTQTTLKQMEEQLFARAYPSDTTDSRLDRLETAVFGSAQNSQAPEARLQNLNQFFQFPNQATPPATAQKQPQQYPKYESFSPPHVSNYRQSTPPHMVQQQQVVDPTETKYPAVTAMEQKVFHQAYENETLEKRLTRLESKVVGRPQQGTLQTRTDQLRMIVFGDAEAGGQSPPSGELAYDPPGDPYFSNQSSYSGSNANYPPPANGPAPSVNPGPTHYSQDFMQALPMVEKKVLRRAYPQDTPENRLNRIEMRVFNTTAPEMSPEDRLYRVVSVVNAKRSGNTEQAYRGGGIGPNYGNYRSSRSSMAPLGSIILMLLMSLI